MFSGRHGLKWKSRSQPPCNCGNTRGSTPPAWLTNSPCNNLSKAPPEQEYSKDLVWTRRIFCFDPKASSRIQITQKPLQATETLGAGVHKSFSTSYLEFWCQHWHLDQIQSSRRRYFGSSRLLIRGLTLRITQHDTEYTPARSIEAKLPTKCLLASPTAQFNALHNWCRNRRALCSRKALHYHHVFSWKSRILLHALRTPQNKNQAIQTPETIKKPSTDVHDTPHST
jgi:hypothetical protein